ncbi:MAG TPA: efflux RND transporter periplasmic adaptor subunit [Rhodocyclaceae bacterium]|nr:efflux RND transporter periplasmic adaptor subunit [Rhodocyclaceae bacterium]
MKQKSIVLSLLAVAVLATAGYGLYALGVKRGMGSVTADKPAVATTDMSAAANESGEDATRRHIKQGIKAGDIDPANGKRVLYYHDPMAPGKRFDAPGKSPFMDMMLWPVYADAGGGAADTGTVNISPRVQQNLGIRTVEVLSGSLASSVQAVGSIAYDERDQVVIQARTAAYVERLNVRATLDRVARGQALVELYVPDWVAAQEEFLSVRRMQGSDLSSLVDAARNRMRQVGMNDEQIRAVETSGKVQARITLRAPIGGVVVELLVREGMTVAPGATLFRLNGTATMWANAEVPESQAALVRPGVAVEARSPALPGTLFKGRVQAILPEVNAATRTLKARVELANPNGMLAPGMFVNMAVAGGAARTVLLVPSEAVIQTGKRTVVMLAEGEGKFRPVDVEIGADSNGETEIRSGLTAGQRVVASGQFLLDSEASVTASGERMQGGGANADTSKGQSAPVAPAQTYQGVGVVEEVQKDALMLSHEAIPALKWGAMTMEFALPKGGLPTKVATGARVQFEFVMGAEGPQLTSITPIASSEQGAAHHHDAEQHGGHQ